MNLLLFSVCSFRKKQLIGINTYLYTFPLTELGRKDYEKQKAICQRKGGTIIERFINNKLAFEHTNKSI